MGALKDVLDGVREVLRITDDVRRSAADLSALAREMREIDGRLIKVETQMDIVMSFATAKAVQARPRELPGPRAPVPHPKRPKAK